MAKRGRKQADSEHSAAQEPRPRGSVQNGGTPHSHWTLMVLFLSLVLDLLGFTVILPLIPSILEYYRHNDQVNHLLVGCTSQLFSIIINIFPGRRMLSSLSERSVYRVSRQSGYLQDVHWSPRHREVQFGAFGRCVLLTMHTTLMHHIRTCTYRQHSQLVEDLMILFITL